MITSPGATCESRKYASNAKPTRTPRLRQRPRSCGNASLARRPKVWTRITSPGSTKYASSAKPLRRRPRSSGNASLARRPKAWPTSAMQVGVDGRTNFPSIVDSAKHRTALHVAIPTKGNRLLELVPVSSISVRSLIVASGGERKGVGSCCSRRIL